MMKSCIICGSDRFSPYWKSLKICSNCGHVTADIEVNNLSFEEIYGEDYFSGGEYLDYIKDKKIFKKNFKRRLDIIFEYCTGGNLIEIGCAHGFFLDLAEEYFNTKGFDISQDAINYARNVLNLNAECEDFLIAPIKRNSTDIVVMWDVVEHLPNPDLYIKKISSILQEGGIFCLTTGDIGSLNARLRREKWRQIHPPTHLHYFSKTTICQLLNKYGFDVQKITYEEVRRSLIQIAYSILVLGSIKMPSLYKAIEKLPLSKISIPINLYDILFVIAKKVITEGVNENESIISCI